jgi:hypothetical protein
VGGVVKAGPFLPRTETKKYNAPAPGVMTPVPWGVLTFNCHQGLPEGCVRFTPKRGDRFVSVEIDDQVGELAYFWIGQREEDLREYCGPMNEPLRIQPGLDIMVFLIEGTCRGSTSPSVVTQGTVSATFLTRRQPK